MLPKIEIIYSEVYDWMNHFHLKKKFGKDQDKTGCKYAAHLQKVWDKNSREILTTMSRISGLEWKYGICLAEK